MDLFDDMVDVPMQPKIKSSFFWFWSKKESLYMAIFICAAILTFWLPVAVTLKTFSCGIVFFVGYIFTFQRFKGRNCDQWFFDLLDYRLKHFNKKYYFDQDYKFNLNLKFDSSPIWQRILINLPLVGFVFKLFIKPKEEQEVAQVQDIFKEYDSHYNLNEIDEQIKGILAVHFYYEWMAELEQDKGIEYFADTSRLLLILERFIENKFKSLEQ